VQVRQVAVPLVQIEAVADEELVGDRETDVGDREVLDESSVGTVEEGHGGERLRAPKPQRLAEVVKREPRVDDVLDDHDVASFDLCVQVLQQADPGAVFVVRGELEEVELVGDRDRAGEVGAEDEARLQRGDEERGLAGVVEREVCAELADACVDLLAAEVDVADAARRRQLARSSLYRSARRVMSRL
jgi:hypothetical protein